MNVAKAFTLLGFSFLGLSAGLLISPIFSMIGIIYQWAQVCLLLVKGLCGGKHEIREEENLADFNSPNKSYRSLGSPVSQDKQSL